ncbi:MAG: VPDSG-CTERM sorting domain-containing protein [Verrucomicrobiia bacterium]
MSKKIAMLLCASALLLSGSAVFGQIGDDDDDIAAPPPRTVPDAGSTALLAGCAVAGLASLRFYFKKK